MSEEKKMTGYPSLDKPWLKHYKEESINFEIPECSVYDFMSQNNKGYENEIAFIYFGRRITYGELLANIDKTALAFTAMGIKKGDIVMICTLNTPETVYCIYALNKIGAKIDFEYPTLSDKDLYSAIEMLEIKAVILLDVFAPKYRDIKKYVDNVVYISPASSLPAVKKTLYKMKVKGVIDTFYDFINKDYSNVKVIKESFEPNEPAIIFHTGGSTGVPKGVLLSNKNFNALALQFKHSEITYGRQDVYLHSIPPFHAYGFSVGIHMPLSLGMSICMSVKIDDASILELFYKFKPQHFAGTSNNMMNIMADKKISGRSMSYLKSIAVGGASANDVDENVVNDFLKAHNANCKLMVGYGMTEVCAAVCTNMDRCNKAGSVGIPLPKSTVIVIDTDTHEELGYDVSGELCISSPCVMLGYYNNEEENKNAIIEYNGKRWIRSGDLASIDRDGFVTIRGRLKRIYGTKDVKTGTFYKIFPDYIEKIIYKESDVQHCAVICLSDNGRRVNYPVAFIVTDKDKEAVKNKVIKRYESELPEHAHPESIVFLDKLPLTPVGKVDYSHLEKMAEEMNKGRVR